MRTLLPILIICFGFISCHTDDGRLYTYTLKNNSGIDIEIMAFSQTNEFREPITTLVDNGEEIVKQYESDPPLNPNIYSYLGFLQGDSIIVSYDNEKQQIFVQETCEGSERNPLNICIYSDRQETFTFTEEDFQNATPCNGDCN
jgi:hypothetical protein